MSVRGKHKHGRIEMKYFTKSLTVGAVVLSMTVSQAFAKPSNEDIAGAIALLGIAALAHHEHHYRKGQAPSGAEDTAMFERGYRDGLHGYTDDLSRTSRAYANGYQAGISERANRNTHRTRGESAGPNVPPFAMQACATLVAKNFGVGKHDVHVTRTVKRGPNDFLVEAAVGHSYMTCVVDGNAEVLEAYRGPMQ
jgi:ribosome modulation factor